MANGRNPYGGYPIQPSMINFRQPTYGAQTQIVDGRPMSVPMQSYTSGKVGSASLPPALNVARLQADRLAQLAGVRKPPTPQQAATPTQQMIAQGQQRRAMLNQIMMAEALKRQKTQQPSSGIFGSQMFTDPMSPAGQALGAAAATGLQLSGYTESPRTFGQNLGAIAQAGMKAYTEAEERQYKREQELAPQFKTVGNTLYRVENGQITGVIGGKKEAKIKGEAGRIKLPDGRITQAVYTEDGKMYEIGDMSKPIDPKDVTYIDQFTTQSVQQLETFFDNQIVPQEKTIKFIDRLADQIVKSPSGFVNRQKAKISAAIKRFAGSSDFTEEELSLALSQGTLTALVGASRIEIFGPGVLTEAEAELARQIFVGDFDKLTHEEALQRLYGFREPAVQGYIRNLGRYNASRAAPVELEPFYEENPIFDWNAWSQGQTVPVTTQQPSVTTTTGGNTFEIN